MRRLVIILAIIACSCSNTVEQEKISEENPQLFERIESNASGVTFKNILQQRIDLNFMNYMYVYTGAGVAVGDIDNDGLEDIYFVSNLGPNKLYKNNGNFDFKDITSSSQTEDYQGFSTGVSMLDVNDDGWLDIYVCKAGSLKDDEVRKNLLFMNQQDGTFKEEASNGDWQILHFQLKSTKSISTTMAI